MPPIAVPSDQLPDTLFLVRVQRVQFRRQAQKRYYTVALAILEPSRFSLSDHFKSGQRLSLQNRPTGLAVQD